MNAATRRTPIPLPAPPEPVCCHTVGDACAVIRSLLLWAAHGLRTMAQAQRLDGTPAIRVERLVGAVVDVASMAEEMRDL